MCVFKGDTAPPNPKLVCFVLYLKIISIFLIKIIYASYSKLSKEQNDGIEMLVGPAVFKLWIKKVKILFWSITQEPFGQLNFNFISEVLGQFTIRFILFFKKVLIIDNNFEIEHKHANFWSGVQYPLKEKHVCIEYHFIKVNLPEYILDVESGPASRRILIAALATTNPHYCRWITVVNVLICFWYLKICVYNQNKPIDFMT